MVTSGQAKLIDERGVVLTKRHYDKISFTEDGLIEAYSAAPGQNLVPTVRAQSLRDAAIAAARRANQAAAGALSEAEMAQFLDMMNRVIDALQRAKAD